MVDPETGWFEIVEVLYYSIEDTKIDKHNYIHNSSARVSRLFSQTQLSCYPRPKEVIFDNRSKFKIHFITLLKDFDIKLRPVTIENLQGNSSVERIYQVVQNIIKTKELDKFIFNFIHP